jgi:hypothetical protein
MSFDPELQALLLALQVYTEEALPTVMRGGVQGQCRVKDMASRIRDISHQVNRKEIICSSGGLEGTSRSSRMSVVFDARNLDKSAPPLPVHMSYTSPNPDERELEISGDKYRLQLLPQDIDEFNHLCLKTIGAGPTICLRSGFKTNHQGSRSTALQMGDFVVLKTQLSAFDRFSLKSSMVSSELQIRLLSAKETLSQWMETFQIARIQYSSESKPSAANPVTSTELQVKKEFARQAQDYQTPLKRKATALTAPAALAYTPYKRQLKYVEDVEKPGILSKAIVEMDDGLEMAGNTLAELMMTHETSVQDLSMGLYAPWSTRPTLSEML